MSEEIERIIDNLESCVGMFDYMLTPIENNLLVSYIKELQQKSQQLKTDLEEANDNATWWNNRFNAVSKENQQLKDRNKLLVKHYKQGEKNLGAQIDITIKYEKVLDEIREYIESNKREASSHFNGKEYVFINYWLECDPNDLIQILDKVNIDPNNVSKMFKNCTTLEPFLEHMDKVKE